MSPNSLETEILRIVHGLQIKGRPKLLPKVLPHRCADAGLSETARQEREAQAASIMLCSTPFRFDSKPVPRELIFAELWTPDGEAAPWKQPGDEKWNWGIVAEREVGEALAGLTVAGCLKSVRCTELTQVEYRSHRGGRIAIRCLRFRAADGQTHDEWCIVAYAGTEVPDTLDGGCYGVSLGSGIERKFLDSEPQPLPYGASAKPAFDLPGYALTEKGLAFIRGESEPGGGEASADGETGESGRRHSPDFRSVHWYGADYGFTSTQAAIVKVLWGAMDNKTPDVGAETLLAAADSKTSKLKDIFRSNDAWGTMIVEGSTKGAKRLADPKKS